MTATGCHKINKANFCIIEAILSKTTDVAVNYIRNHIFGNKIQLKMYFPPCLICHLRKESFPSWGTIIRQIALMRRKYTQETILL